MKMTIVCSCMMAASTAWAIDFNAPIEKVAGDFKFIEGPVWHAANGELLFSDIPADRIVRCRDGKCETFRAPSRNSNGLTLDKIGRLLVKDFAKPNGLAFTPDEKTLYINDTERGHIRAFDVAADGMLTNSREFAQTPGADGMKVDTAGNVYCTSQKGVMVFERTGKHLGTFATPEQPANCGFGDADRKTLYMTCRTGLYRVRLAIPGVRVP